MDFSLSELLDSPLLLKSSGLLPSPTTGTILAQREDHNLMDFSFHPQPTVSYSGNLSYREPQPANMPFGDGFNWRKYGQKQVKGSENPRSYYKCTNPNCSVRKQVARSLEGEITEIVYKGKHNHPKPDPTRKSSSSSTCLSEHSFASHGSTQTDSMAAPENFSRTQTSKKRELGVGEENGEDVSDAKRWKIERENEGMSGGGERVRDQRVVVQTISNTDKLEDGYWWRKYGQKVVKGNPNPRSYYKCTHVGCPVRKHIERASNDLRAVITTYAGKHNHDVPAARAGTRLPPNNYAAIRPSATISNPNNAATDLLPDLTRLPSTSEIPVDILQSHTSFGFSEFGNSVSMGSHINQAPLANMISRTKEEPSDDIFQLLLG